MAAPENTDGKLKINPGLIAGLIAILLVVIIAIQNNDQQTVSVLFWDGDVSTTWLVVITIVLTVIGQWLLGKVWSMRRKRKD